MMRHFVVLLFVLVAVAGCAKKPGMTQAASPPPGSDGTSKRMDGPTSTPASRSASAPTNTPTEGARPKLADYAADRALEDTHFDFDRYDIRDRDRSLLDKHAAWLRERPNVIMLVEGHCDERGTAEYNISLGERRAKTTLNYLVSRGIAADRLTMVSYGEQRPVCRESSEACWARNRRAHFLVKQR
jgi:peptidoglycan-associated lipoprotein